MTAPAPKPIADCPNPECKHFCAMYEAPFVSNDGLMHKVKCDDCGYMGPWARTSDEAIRLHNALCRPQQSAEPAGWIYGPTLLEGNEVTEEDVTLGAESRPVGEDWLPFYLASPGPSELVEEMERLEAELRSEVSRPSGAVVRTRDEEIAEEITLALADRLSAVIREGK